MTTSPIRQEIENHWAGLLTPPHSPLRAKLAERVFRLAVRTLPVRVVLPGGERLGAGGDDAPVMRIVRPEAFFHRLGVDAKIGFGEAYMVGDWTSADPAATLTPFAARLATLVPRPLQVLRRWVDARRPDDERNTVEGARSNIHRHYDLSNDLFAAFLDETMTYSSAWFAETDDLPAAQRRKIDGILDYAGVRQGSTVLEIGTGWGGLAVEAARRGATVTTLTISPEQKRLADKRIAEAGVADRVTVQLCDYRVATGTYDAVVSVEMIEAVGEQYWPAYFGTLDRLLAPGGAIALQAITMPHDRLLATRHSHTWITKYVFPGGQLLSVPEIERQVGALPGMRITGRRRLGGHYARTLHQWRERFTEQSAYVTELGFDQVFHRLWEFYLAYSEAGFRSGYLDVWQLRMTRG